MGIILMLLPAVLLSCTEGEVETVTKLADSTITYTMPDESAPHEGTWLMAAPVPIWGDLPQQARCHLGCNGKRTGFK
ncbi:hypothetical protein [Pedobacter kyungheensis]|uniref:hypothetical protein n=1 Tax=Pedobacter kyungheensis TaxID=1069985 RepID=UPI001FD81118|nr:hypothetical protein [Pedobacter kyungheensis]